MSCRYVSTLVSASLDRLLSFQERFALRAHLLFCRACNEYSRQIRILDKVLRRRMTTPEDLPETGEVALGEEARTRIVRTVGDEIRARHSEPSS